MKLAVVGASGRMGQQIGELAFGLNFEPWIGVTQKTKKEFYKKWVHDLSDPQLNEAEIIIDFALAEGWSQRISIYEKLGKPVVLGVTGLTENQVLELDPLSLVVPVLWSPNFSLGITLFKSLLKVCAQLTDYDFQLIEAHHKHKKDAPSGTALFLQAELQRLLPQQSLSAPLAYRGGGVIGEHRLEILGDYEKITIEHQAIDRKVFAQGALKVAQWLVKQPNGRYTMDHYFGLNK